MKKYLHSILLALFLSSSLLLGNLTANAAEDDGTIDNDHKYVWSENTGWILMTESIHILDEELTGYAWGENIGWISFNCANTNSCDTVDFKVENDGEGNLEGYAWSENTGWINFNPNFGGVTIDENGEFHGFAWGENIGWINFNCSNTNSCDTVNFKLLTDWRPVSSRGPKPDPDPQPEPNKPGKTTTTGSQSLKLRAVAPSESPKDIQPFQPPYCEARNSTQNPFTDVQNHQYQEAIQYLYSNCIVQGKSENTFAPEDTITRAEVLKMVLESNQIILSNYTDIFTDVTAEDWFANYVTTGFLIGIIQGHSDNTFKPNDSINRAEILKMIIAAKGGDSFMEKHRNTSLYMAFFADVKPENWFYKYFDFAFSKGIVDLHEGGFFYPADNVTRAEVARIIYGIDKILQEAPLEEE